MSCAPRIVVVVPLVNQLWWIYLWAFSIEVASLVFLPARDASIPDLVDNDDLPLANGLVLGTSYGTIPLGAALFALVTALPGHDLLGRPFALGVLARRRVVRRVGAPDRAADAAVASERSTAAPAATTVDGERATGPAIPRRVPHPARARGHAGRRSQSRSGSAHCSRSASCSCATCCMRATRSSVCSSRCSVSVPWPDCAPAVARPRSTTYARPRSVSRRSARSSPRSASRRSIGLAFVGAAAFGAGRGVDARVGDGRAAVAARRQRTGPRVLGVPHRDPVRARGRRDRRRGCG